MITTGIILILLGIFVGFYIAYDNGNEYFVMGVIGALIGAFIGGMCSIFFLVNGFSKLECENYTKLSGIKSSWTISTGCLVNNDGKIITLAQYVRLQVPNAVYGNAEQNIKVKIEQ